MASAPTTTNNSSPPRRSQNDIWEEIKAYILRVRECTVDRYAGHGLAYVSIDNYNDKFGQLCTQFQADSSFQAWAEEQSEFCVQEEDVECRNLRLPEMVQVMESMIWDLSNAMKYDLEQGLKVAVFMEDPEIESESATARLVYSTYYNEFKEINRPS